MYILSTVSKYIKSEATTTNATVLCTNQVNFSAAVNIYHKYITNNTSSNQTLNYGHVVDFGSVLQ